VLEALPEPLLVCNEALEIILVNNQTELVFGYHRSEMIGRPIEMLLPERYRFKHVEHRSRYVLRPTVREMGSGLNIVGLRKNGDELPMDVKLAPVVSISGVCTIAIVRPLLEARGPAPISTPDRDAHDN
jgi:protein-histidine pros-kinase